MKLVKRLTQRIELALSYKCSEMIIPCLELEISNGKGEVLFHLINKIE